MATVVTPRPAPRPAPRSPGGPITRTAGAVSDTGPLTDRRVLVLVEDPAVRRALDESLRTEGLSARATTDLASAEVLMRSYRPGVLIVDTRRLEAEVTRRAFADPEVRLVVHGADAATRVAVLRRGADDALAPDCTPVEVALRCVALLRRPSARHRAAAEQQLHIGRVMVDLGRRTISVDGREVATTRLEFDLFAELCRRPTEVCSRSQLLASVWGPRWVGDPHVVDVHLSNLRRKVREYAPDLQLLLTVRGVGFRLSDDSGRDRADQDRTDQA